MTRLEALKLARKHEGLQVWAYGENTDRGGCWSNDKYCIYFEKGKISVDGHSFNSIIRDLKRYPNANWTLRNTIKIKNTKIARKLNKGNIIAEESGYIIVKEE